MAQRARARTDKYLRRDAVPELDELLAAVPESDWQRVVVVPARDEGGDLLDTARGPAAGTGRTLLIVVVNGDRPSAGNEETLQRLGGRAPWARSAWIESCASIDVCVVDRASPGRLLPERAGVGRARKIGGDLALALIHRGRVESSWIHMTDADARLPSDHCEAIEGLAAGSVAHVARFRHVRGDDDAVHGATLEYERWLRYYVLGLQSAGSAYAHHSIGSLISVRAEAYAAVRGVPQREAGEDFYLLNKLRKLGPIARGRGAEVEIVSRRSNRVPFGTGPAVAESLRGATRRHLDPRCFDALGRWLRTLDACVDGVDPNAAIELLPSSARRVLEGIGELAALREICERYRGPQRRHQMIVRFDGFRTLKLLHALRDQLWPAQSWEEVLRGAPFLVGVRGSSVAEQCHELSALEPRDQ